MPAVGWFGLGPGLYQVAFPYQNSAPRNVGIGIREYAQEDYLQTVLEWGWLGTLWCDGAGLRRPLARPSTPTASASGSQAGPSGTCCWRRCSA
ncbi:MAG: hypothetical protein WDO13_16770 [Verrucomicrobiota bacterium]